MDKEKREELLNTNNSFFRLFHLNHLLMGEDYDFICEFGKQHQEKFCMDFSDYHMLLAGPRSKTIADWAYMGTTEQIDLYVQARRQIRGFLMDHGYDCEVFPADCIRSRQIVILLFPLKQCDIQPEKVAWKVNEVLYAVYGRKPPWEHMPTMLLSHLSGKESVAEAFQHILELQQMTFFMKNAEVITNEAVHRFRIPFGEREVFDRVNEIEEQVFLGKEEKIAELTQKLFAEELKHSTDIRLVQDTIVLLRQKINRWEEWYILSDKTVQEVFDIDQYDFIEQVAEYWSRILTDLSGRLTREVRQRSCVTRDALRYIRNNYLRDINQADIAEHINVTRSHLSRLFNQDMNMSIPAYLTNLRMEKARELLLKTNLKVAQIGEKSGFSDQGHFIRVFKRVEGVTPGQFRKRECYGKK